MKYNVSRDGGETYKSATHHVLFGTFFFVSEDRRVLVRSVFTVTDLLSQVGGLVSLLNIFLIVVGTIVNMYAILAAIAEQVYYFTPDGSSYERVSLTCWDLITFPCAYLGCCKTPSKKQKSYKQALKASKKDLNIVNVIET